MTGSSRKEEQLERQLKAEQAQRTAGRRTRTTLPAPPLAAILAFEEEHPDHPGGKTHAIRTTFGISPTRYYQILNAGIDTREALEINPILTRQLRTQRDARTRARATRTLRPERTQP